MKKNKIAYIATAATITAATFIMKDRVNACAIQGAAELCDTKPKKVATYIGSCTLTTVGALAIVAAATKKLAAVFKIEEDKKRE